MLHRMKWEDDVIKTKDESEPKLNNKCTLVWEVIKMHNSIKLCYIIEI